MKYKCLNNDGYVGDVFITGNIYDSDYMIPGYPEAGMVSELAKIYPDDWKEYNRKEKLIRILKDE